MAGHNAIVDHWARYWDSHVAAGTATITTAAFHGFSIVGVLQGVCVGVGVFVITNLLKRIWPKLFK